MDWIFYNAASHPDAQQRGAICRLFGGNEAHAVMNLREHEDYMLCEEDITDKYVDFTTGQLADKSSLSLQISKDTVMADGVDELVITGLPVPCNVDINGATVFVDDGALEFSSDETGQYFITIDTAAYLKEEVIVYAV